MNNHEPIPIARPLCLSVPSLSEKRIPSVRFVAIYIAIRVATLAVFAADLATFLPLLPRIGNGNPGKPA